MKLLLAISCAFLIQFTNNYFRAQVCVDLPEMNGTPGTFVCPTDWNIWNSSPDIISGNGSYPGTVSANINDVDGLSLAGGEVVFLLINGVLGANTEGITTQLSGLIPGTTYFAAVQWQQATLDYIGISADPSGGKLGIYLDGNLHQLFSSSGGVNDGWQTATIIFVASSVSHTIGLKGELLDNSSRGAIVVDNLPCPIILGLDISRFEAEAIENSLVKLSWELRAEASFDYLEIQRSDDLENWISLEKTSQDSDFSGVQQVFIDQEPVRGKSYYRVKEVDFDGEFNYSEVRSVEISVETTDITIYPNPASGIIQVFGTKVQEMTISDMSGRIVDHSSLIVEESDHSIRLDVTAFTEGTYLIRTPESIKLFVKQ